VVATIDWAAIRMLRRYGVFGTFEEARLLSLTHTGNMPGRECNIEAYVVPKKGIEWVGRCSLWYNIVPS